MDALEERIKGLRERYARTLPGFVAEIRKLMVQASERKVPRADLLRPFHTLAGTAGTLGYEEIATLAWETEHILCSNSAPEVTADELRQLTARLADLEAVLGRHLEAADGTRDTTWSAFEGGGVV